MKKAKDILERLLGRAGRINLARDIIKHYMPSWKPKQGKMDVGILLKWKG